MARATAIPQPAFGYTREGRVGDRPQADALRFDAQAGQVPRGAFTCTRPGPICRPRRVAAKRRWHSSRSGGPKTRLGHRAPMRPWPTQRTTRSTLRRRRRPRGDVVSRLPLADSMNDARAYAGQTLGLTEDAGAKAFALATAVSGDAQRSKSENSSADTRPPGPDALRGCADRSRSQEASGDWSRLKCENPWKSKEPRRPRRQRGGSLFTILYSCPLLRLLVWCLHLFTLVDGRASPNLRRLEASGSGCADRSRRHDSSGDSGLAAPAWAVTRFKNG